VVEEEDRGAQPQFVAAGPDWNQVEVAYVCRIHLNQKERGGSALVEWPSGVPQHWGEDEARSRGKERGVGNLVWPNAVPCCRPTPFCFRGARGYGGSLLVRRYRSSQEHPQTDSPMLAAKSVDLTPLSTLCVSGFS